MEEQGFRASLDGVCQRRRASAGRNVVRGREELLYCHIPRVYGIRRLVEVEHATNTTTTVTAAAVGTRL